MENSGNNLNTIDLFFDREEAAAQTNFKLAGIPLMFLEEVKFFY
jgi:hypothetical protein